MIPASYFFRRAYHDRFEEAAPANPEPPLLPDRLALDRATAAILGFAFGAAHLTLGASPAVRHDRRR